MYCVRCGRALPADSAFCVYCGASTSLENGPGPSRTPVPALMAAPALWALPAPQPSSRRRRFFVATALLVSILMYVAMTALVVRLAVDSGQEPGKVPVAQVAQPEPAVDVTLPPLATPGGAGTEVDAVARARRSVVFVTTPEGTGTGIVLTSDGYVLTNYHVVEGARSVELRFADGRKLPAQVLKNARAPDLALLRVSAEGLAPAVWGDSSRLSLGQTVLAIGHSLGIQGEPTVSRGIVSAFRMEQGIRHVQTDAAVNPGNSGGPLVDLTGAVVGITTRRIDWAGLRPVQGMNLAISGNDVRRWVEQNTGQ